MKRQEQLNGVLWNLLGEYLQKPICDPQDALDGGKIVKTYNHWFKVEFDDATYIVKVTKKQVVR